MSDDYSRFEPPTEESPEWQDADSSTEGEEAVENYEDDYYDSSDAFLTDEDDRSIGNRPCEMSPKFTRK